ncbi:menaquinone-dependent protoporphyrinogen IX dehydrogenase [Methylobacter psychrophilus]|uniref:menaquinone-dependent protoporphyrinogen IX dehydrogenase n=1 Tax=Methylobacter psychrophilus TaxID=96941 RepID=UPI0021D4D7AC|nr:menaquinone-dependent protoporphyrinogen IX dehydrogenase [Methylobacter psychrophilus]
MANILIVYSSTDGQTQKICHRLRTVIEQEDHLVAVISVTEATQLDLAKFDKIVIGASIRYGHHSSEVITFIEKNRRLLDRKPNAFFSVNLVARKPEKCRPENNPYLQKFLRQIVWKPKEMAVFAGKLDYPGYRSFDRSLIRLIMWMTKGPTDPMAVIEFTNWLQVDLFARLIIDMK